MKADPSAVVREYFSRIQNHDKDVYKLFHKDAVLTGLGRQTSGRQAIAEFYSGAIEGGRPSPRAAGPLLAGGSRVAAEVFIELANGLTLHFIDLFVVEDGLIRSLTYFQADEVTQP